MSSNGEFSVRLPDGAEFNYRSGTNPAAPTEAAPLEASPKETVQAAESSPRPTAQVEAIRTQMQRVHSGDSVTALPNTSDVDRGVDPDRFAKNIDELGSDDFFTNFSNQELETVLKSVERLGQTGVDESDPDNTFAHEVFDLLATAIKSKLADDLTQDDFDRSTLKRKIPQIFAKDFLADLERLKAALIKDPQLRTSATNLMAYIHKVANYQAPDEANKPF